MKILSIAILSLAASSALCKNSEQVDSSTTFEAPECKNIPFSLPTAQESLNELRSSSFRLVISPFARSGDGLFLATLTPERVEVTLATQTFSCSGGMELAGCSPANEARQRLKMLHVPLAYDFDSVIEEISFRPTRYRIDISGEELGSRNSIEYLGESNPLKSALNSARELITSCFPAVTNQFEKLKSNRDWP